MTPSPTLLSPSETPTTNVSTSRSGARRAVAATVVLAPALVGINSLFHPEVEMNGASILAGAAADPSAWFVVHVVAAIGALLGLPAAAGLRLLVLDRGRRLATTGLALVMVGSPLLAMTFAAEASVLRLAAGLDPAPALALAEAYARTPEFYAVGAAVALSSLGSLLLGLALLTSRAVPRWMAGGYLAGTLGSLLAAPGTPVGPAAFGVVALVSVGLAAQIARPGAAGPRHPGAVVPTLLVAAVVTVISATGASASTRAVEAELAEVRRATVEYHDVDVAIADGFTPTDDCVEGPGGVMGYHYMHWPRVMDGQVDPTRPEVLLYVPQADGTPRLVGVEYISLTETSLFGQPFDPGPGGSFALHAWIWQANPDGTFAGLNPSLSC